MEMHNKIFLAGELLVDAAKIYRSAETNSDFAKSILISGAVIGIVAPWLDELGIKSSHVKLAERVAQRKGIALATLSEEDRAKELGKSISLYRLAYNSLKHAGHGKRVKASDDLIFEANLKEEAHYLIGNAIDDFNNLPLPQQAINTQLSDELLTLLQSGWVA